MFPLNLPGQKDVLSHTEFINVHILHALILETIHFELTKKPTKTNWWVLPVDVHKMGQVLQSISSASLKRAMETTAKGLSRESELLNLNKCFKFASVVLFAMNAG